jgi:hypothetical protein
MDLVAGLDAIGLRDNRETTLATLERQKRNTRSWLAAERSVGPSRGHYRSLLPDGESPYSAEVLRQAAEALKV